MSNYNIIWDSDGKRGFEYGVDHGVLYPPLTDGADTPTEGAAYGKGVAWNGLTAVTSSPEGAEPTELWADNILYGVLMSPEKLKLALEHYATPTEFYPCDGILIKGGAMITGQPRKKFGFSYRTKIGNDTDPEAGYKLHLVYGCRAAVAERAHNTMNDSPEVITFSREVSTTPVVFTLDGKEVKTPELVLDSTVVSSEAMAQIESILYGSEAIPGYLPTPEEVFAIIES